MTRGLRMRMFLGALVLAFTAPAWLPAADSDSVPTDRLLPRDVALYVSVPDVSDLKAKFAQTAMGAISEDSAFEPFKGELHKALGQLSEEWQQRIGVPLKDLFDLPSGEMALAVLTPPGKKMSAVLFFDFGDSEKTVTTLLENVEKAFEEREATGDDEDVDGTKVSVWTFKGEGQQQGPNQLVYFMKDTMLVLATDLATSKDVLARWDGKHSETFADNEKYNFILEKCSAGKSDDDGLIVWYLDPMGLVRSVMTQLAATNPQLGLAIGFLEPLGVNGLKAVGGSLHLATDEFDSVSKSFLMIEPPTKGVLNVFQFPAIEQKPPRWVPANASLWVSANWDLAGAYKAIATLVDMFRGPGSTDAVLDQLAENEGGPKVHLKKDVIDAIAGRVQVVSEPGKKQGDATPQERLIVAIALKDAKKFQATLSKIAKTPGFPGTSREFKGATIYEMELPDFSGGAEPKQGGLAVGQDQLLFSNDVTVLETMLRGDQDGDTLVDSPEYKRVAEHLPAKTSISTFSRSDSQLETLWDSAKNGQLSDQLSAILPNLPQLDWSKLPEFDSIKKFLQPSGSYTVPDKKGVLFVGFGTKKKS